MQDFSQISTARQQRALWLSTIAFTTCFAVWMIFSIIGIQIKKDLGLNDTEFGLLIATPVLSGSMLRIFLGVWADQLGGRKVLTAVMLAGAAATWMLTHAQTYPQFLIAALGVVHGSSHTRPASSDSGRARRSRAAKMALARFMSPPLRAHRPAAARRG